MIETTCVADVRARLGEGPCWDAKHHLLWWVDVVSCVIHCFDPATGRDRTYRTPDQVGCLAVREQGGLVVALANGFHFFDPETGRFELITDPEADLPATRFNDGRTDRQGRFWSGSTVRDPATEPRRLAALYRLDVDRTCSRVIEGLGCSNGLAWSPDSRTMYHTDSLGPYVWAYDFDPASGAVSNRREFIDLSATNGIGDGAAVDADGCYWLAAPFQGTVMRHDPSGELMQTLHIPAGFPTCCEFGGADLDTLYVTTATFDRPSQEGSLAGGLFAVDAGVRGIAAAGFRA